MPSGTYHNPDQKHLHVVCTDPDDIGNVILVSITTWTNNFCDGTCILLPHEHQWLYKPKSWVCYRKADFFTVESLERGLDQGKIEKEATCNAQVFLRIYKGLCNSPNTPRKIKKHINCPEITTANNS